MKKSYLRTALLWVIPALIQYSVIAQTATLQIPAAINVLPPGPNAAALGRYGDIPVGHYTGVPSIFVPMYVLEGAHGLSVPVGLNYHASGIRVDDIGSWVGLGWSLDCGGVVTRSVHGTADDGPTGYLRTRTGNLIDDYLDNKLSPNARYNLETKASDGKIDLEPDIYTFNFVGHTGQFVFDHKGQPRLIPQQGLSIEQRSDTSGFKITDEIGTVYQFLDAEESESNYVPNGWRYNPENYTSSWYLTRITPLVGPSIKFIYGVPRAITFPTNVNENKSVLIDFEQTVPSQNGGGIPLGRITPYRTWTNLTVWTIALQRVVSADQTIDLYSSQQTSVTGATQLDSIVINSVSERRIKQYAFRYEQQNDRLFLLQVQEQGANQEHKPPYLFAYNGAIPALYTDAQDHWGYYNRNNPGLGRVPTAALTVGSNSSGFSTIPRYLVVSGANRSPDATLAQAGILKTITYPTGGTTKFDYELNNFGYINSRANPVQIITRPRRVSARGSNLVEHDSAQFRLATDQVVHFTTSLDIGPPDRAGSFVSSATVTYKCLSCDVATRLGLPYIADNSTGNRSHDIMLPRGTYRIYSEYLDPRPSTSGFASIQAYFQDSTGTTPNIVSGGLRIRRIQSRPSANAPVQTKEYRYQLATDTARSSGCSVSGIPTYRYNYKVKTRELLPPPNSLASSLEFINRYTMLTSNSCGQAGLTQGAPVGYSEVTEFDGVDGVNGKTVYKFSTAIMYPDNGNSNYFPFAPSSSYDYRRGKQLNLSVFKRNGNNFDKLSRTINQYSIPRQVSPSNSATLLASRIIGLKLGRTMDDVADNETAAGPSGFSHQPFPDEFDARKYFYTSEWIHPTRTLVRHYESADTTHFTETSTTLRYDNPLHYQLSGIEQRGTSDEVFVTRFRYPLDFTVGTTVNLPEPSASIALLTGKHMLSALIEKQYWHRIGTDSVLVNAQLVHYGGILPKRTWQLIVPTPIGSGSFSAASVDPNGTLSQDARYREQLIFERYDAHGNTLQQRQVSDVPISYLWGYNAVYPIAAVKNARYVELVAVLGQPLIDELAGATPGTDVQVRAKLSSLRTATALKNAQITTYTYAPLVGITSQTDPSGRTITYEYDGLGRLIRTRDERGRVLSQQQYHYARRP